MAHIQDRWWRDKTDPDTGRPVLDSDGKPVQERTELYGKGLRYKVRYIDPNGKERAKSFPDKAFGKAKEFRTKVENDLYAGSYKDPRAGDVLFREFTTRVLKGRSQDPSTVEIADNQLLHVYPFLGDKRLRSFSNDLIRDWLDWLARPHLKTVKSGRLRRAPAASYRADIFDLVSSILDVAVKEGRITANPCRDDSISRPVPVKTQIVPWPDVRRNTVALALPERFKPVIPLGAGLGLRQGEIFAFTLDDVDRERMVYNVNRQVTTANGKLVFKLPKGHKTRSVPLGQGVLEDLENYASNFPSVSITLPWGEDDSRKTETVNVLMTNRHGGLYSRQWFNQTIWTPTFAKAGLSYRERRDGTHALRHLFASHLLAQGVSIKELAAFLGHSSEMFTLKTYVHLMPNSYERARVAIDGMFKPRARTSTKDGTA